jgi:hypothetical protein
MLQESEQQRNKSTLSWNHPLKTDHLIDQKHLQGYAPSVSCLKNLWHKFIPEIVAGDLCHLSLRPASNIRDCIPPVRQEKTSNSAGMPT